MLRSTNVLFMVLILSAVATPILAKKVICIDDHDDPNFDDDLTFLHNHEGYLRALGIGANDKIQIGGDLKDCLANLKNDDELVIVAHGTGTGSCFAWGGTEYTGFGGGANQGTNPHPVPAAFANLMRIKVEFCACWSDRDPDGAGTDRSGTDKIKDAMGGAGNGHTVTGFNDSAWAEVVPGLRSTGGTAAEKVTAIAAAAKCLKDDKSWMENAPPANKPGTGGQGQPKNQQNLAQAIVDACAGIPASVTVTVSIPNQVGEPNVKTGYVKPVNKVSDPPANSGAGGCSCDQLPGCGFGIQSTIELPEAIPTVSDWGVAVMALLVLLGGTIVVKRQRKLAGA